MKSRREHLSTSLGFVDPSSHGGQLLTFGFETFPAGLGEPMNIIISGNSDPEILINQNINGGLITYFNSFQYSIECLGQHIGSHQMADLGDGNGGRNETAVIRFDYGNPFVGTCEETFQGGGHFRYWMQNGPLANTSAVFIAASIEKPASDDHDIIFDGYNLGRDWIVGNITGTFVNTSAVSNTTQFTGHTSSAGFNYTTSIQYMSGFQNPTSTGINHFLSVGGGPDNITAIDGLIAVLTAKITGRPKSSSASSRLGTTTKLMSSTLVFSSLLALIMLEAL